MSDKIGLMLMLAQARDGMVGNKWWAHAVTTVIASVIAAAASTYVTSIRNEEQIHALVERVERTDRNVDKIDGKMDALRGELFQLYLRKKEDDR